MKPPRYCPPDLVAHIPLALAMLCAEEKCEAVFVNQAACPACGGREMLGLSAVLARREKAEVGR